MTHHATQLRFRWDHRHPLHRFAVRNANRVLAAAPLRPKYALAAMSHRARPPYSVMSPGSAFIQVGAPLDTLYSGRSRGMHLALRTRRSGRAVIVEPDPASASAFRAASARLGLDHVTVVNAGAWHEAATLKLFVDPRHPATNFTEGCTDYDADRMAEFEEIEVPVNTLDAIAAELGLDHVDLVSITTNGAEPEILKGMQGILDGGLRYLCLARTGPRYGELVSDLGFDLMSLDDRGYTYVRRQ